MSEPQAVRAWADYDEWLVVLDRIGDAMNTGVDYFTSWEMPNGAEGEPHQAGGCVPMKHWFVLMGYGPLRSLRVLFDTGHEMALERQSSAVTVSMTPGTYTPLPPGCVLVYFYDAKDKTIFGKWFGPDTTDAEAVELAIADAVRWIGGSE